MGCGCNKKNTDKKAGETTPMHGFVSPVKETVNKKEGPSLIQKAMNFGEALVNHVADGMTKVTKLQLSGRLAVCIKCPFNHDGTCSKCGCVIATKAQWRSADCPEEYWPKIKKD